MRTPAEFETAHIPGSHNVPLDLLREHRDELRDHLDEQVVLVCRSGQRAAQAEQALAGAGLPNLRVLTGGITALSRFPEQKKLLLDHLDDEEFMDKAADEIVRFVTPVIGFIRTVTRDHTYRNTELKEGDRILMLYGSANRDDTVFANPDELDLTRDPNPHLGFGIGPHFCLGANLARTEIKVVFQELFGRLPDIAVPDGVGDVEADVAFVEPRDVVEVAGDVASRAEHRVEAERADLGKGLGEEVALELRGEAHLLVDPLHVVVDLLVPLAELADLGVEGIDLALEQRDVLVERGGDRRRVEPGDVGLRRDLAWHEGAG